MRDDWRWFIVVDDEGNCDEVFNSKMGAEVWAVEHGGTVIKVKEVKNDRKSTHI